MTMDEITEIKLQLGRVVSHMESERDSRTIANEKISDIHGFLFGSTSHPVSVSLRLDRLEQIQENRKWFMRAIGTGVIGLIIERVVSFFKSGGA